MYVYSAAQTVLNDIVNMYFDDLEQTEHIMTFLVKYFTL